MSETGKLTLEDPLGEIGPRGGTGHSKKLCEQGGALCIGALRALCVDLMDCVCYLTALSILLASIYHMLP